MIGCERTCGPVGRDIWGHKEDPEDKVDEATESLPKRQNVGKEESHCLWTLSGLYSRRWWEAAGMMSDAR